MSGGSQQGEHWQVALYCYNPRVCLTIRILSPTNIVAHLQASVSEPWAPGSGQLYNAQLSGALLVSRPSCFPPLWLLPIFYQCSALSSPL